MTTIRTILVPTDFSDSAQEAIDKAFELAGKLGAKIHLLHAYGIPPIPDAMGMGVGVDLLGPIERAASTQLKQLAERYAGRSEYAAAGLEMGDPRDVILQHARQLEADLIVMGTHGRRGMQHFMLGSVAEGVVRHAPCPVLVVPLRKR